MAESGTPVLRRTRFVCVSDTHNATPNGAFKLPKGDVLIHAGDLTNQGSYSELQKTIRWIEDADFEAKIVIAGNHDITLDSGFYAQYGLYFHNQDPQDTSKCQTLLENSSSITWLKHDSATIQLGAATGPHTKFKIFGSPYSPSKGMWAFGYDAHEAPTIWDKIPLDADIVVTHTPPKYHCDESRERRAAGCEALRQVLWRVRPLLAICGHVHEGRGSERVLWDLSFSNTKYKEIGTEMWTDPGHENNKLSLIDLTGRRGSPLQNDGAVGDFRETQETFTMTTDLPSRLPQIREGTSNSKVAPMVEISRIGAQLLAISPDEMSSGTRGQGGIPPSMRCDLNALSGRLERKETCVVNAAIMASSWPHGRGGKKFNKPIVVDIDLPVWE
ncbi:metallo-dependent phosphatase-2 [Coleophoma crateriformis]|uniref:Metallo-dependent phosphatase-2 n=1 Tax=Coleophoma crateriformis TaxID=565419 RepID=A0A3D8SCC2_9HELO|nr:metallo-dependent phosphatase-2 [Coleophoma crateriformis]